MNKGYYIGEVIFMMMCSYDLVDIGYVVIGILGNIVKCVMI